MTLDYFLEMDTQLESPPSLRKEKHTLHLDSLTPFTPQTPPWSDNSINPTAKIDGVLEHPQEGHISYNSPHKFSP